MVGHASMQGTLACERAWVTIDLNALASNIRQLKQQILPQTALMAVVKADGYGHGAVTVARTALEHGATWLGVATIIEGIELRQANIDAPILVLGATHTVQEIEAIVRWQLQPTLCSPEQALTFSRHLQHALPVHLMIDTGMSRLGPIWQQGATFIEFVHRLPHLTIASIYSHLATADHADTSFMLQQQSRLQEVLSRLQTQDFPLPKLHLANSAGMLSGPQFHYDLVRVGLALYGLYPSSQFQNKIHLQPVMQVKARVTQVKTLPAGSGVSYNHTFTTDQPSIVAVVGIGYADGVPRLLSNQMKVIIRGRLVPQIGAITMDQLMVDVSSIPDLQVGEMVTLLGQDGNATISAEVWAETLGTISYEVVCGFKHRLPRVLVNHGAPQR
ncbi:alanine racemase [Acaryochloris sp. IP29b_bin.148]|uniref:alanine racemase n=1 Tax=Acaryochloris sp. IP29b_bin.148 TaxID=2969218 RepID=UPI002614F338|nr:alanine racemase [Acaryochloris sp. IP29b_bin.148]